MTKARIEALDDQLYSLNRWIPRAAEYILDYFNRDEGVFWRESFHVGKSEAKKHPTSTNRCFFALWEYLRYLQEENLYKEYEGHRFAWVLRTVGERYFGLILKKEGEDGLEEDGLDVVRSSSTNRKNMFTDGLLLTSVALLEGLSSTLQWCNTIDTEKRVEPLNLEIKAIKNELRGVAAERLLELVKAHGGRIHPDDEIHDFVTLYIVRGLDTFYEPKSDKSVGAKQSARGRNTKLDTFYELKSGKLKVDKPESKELERVERALSSRLREDVLRLLAYEAAGVSSHFDPAALAFSVSLLNRFPMPNTYALTRKAAKAVVSSQAADGVWPSARLISSQGRGLLHVSSYEVALTLTQLLLRRFDAGDLDFYDEVELALTRAFNLIRSNDEIVIVGKGKNKKIRGWSNDHNQRSDLTESWTTAIILTFLIHYRDALLQLRQALILRKYDSQPANMILPPTEKGWLDLVPALRRPADIKKDLIDHISDPTDDAALTKGLKKNIIEPIADSPVHRPQVASLILYGKPATRKTTLVAQLARSLHWPLIILSPPHFLSRGGLEGIEAQSAEIFSDLMRLRRVVVLFDECEDFFKKRESNVSLGNRTTGAFLTAGMLPRLQNLHENHWIIYVLATNSGIMKLDPAVRRLGRFDHSENMQYPTLEAQVRYIKNHKNLPKETPGELTDVHNAIINALQDYDEERLEKEREKEKERRKHKRQSPNEDEDEDDGEHVTFSYLDKIVEEFSTRDTLEKAEVAIQLSRLVKQKVPPPLSA